MTMKYAQTKFQTVLKSIKRNILVKKKMSVKSKFVISSMIIKDSKHKILKHLYPWTV